MTISQLLSSATDELKKANIASARLDAEVLLAFVLEKPRTGSDPLQKLSHLLKGSVPKKISREFFYSHDDTNISKEDCKKFHKLIQRRKNHEPVAYIIGKKEFYGLDFFVDSAVLIPRPETELLVELVLKYMKQETRNIKLDIVDIGTGSGNIIISLAKTLEALNMEHETKFCGIDNSTHALNVATKNAKIHGVNRNINFLHGNLLEPLLNSKYKIPNTICDKLIILANLPYLKGTDILQDNVFKFEPHSALFAGTDGLKFYKELFEQINNRSDILKSDIVMFLEIDPSQKSSIKTLAKKYFKNADIKIFNDLANKPRVCKITIE